MIFPDKPRPPWRQPQSVKLKSRAVETTIVETKPQKPPGYWRERIEFAVIIVGMYFWIQYWIQYQ
jgi:hypothetical protein